MVLSNHEIRVILQVLVPKHLVKVLVIHLIVVGLSFSPTTSSSWGR